MRFKTPVAAGTLHRQAVRLRDERLDKASLFPFFDAGGRVEALMVVWPDSPTIAAVELRPDLVEVAMWGAVQLDVDFASLENLDTAAAAKLAAGRWHYDPWWVLRKPRYDGHPAVPILKATNCAGKFPEPFRQLYFEHDLSRVARLTIDYQTFQRFTPDLLPLRSDPALEPANPTTSGWRLDPVWQRPGWLSRFHA